MAYWLNGCAFVDITEAQKIEKEAHDGRKCSDYVARTKRVIKLTKPQVIVIANNFSVKTQSGSAIIEKIKMQLNSNLDYKPRILLIDKVPTPPTNLAFYFNRIRESKDQVNFPYEKELTKSKQILDNQTKIFFPDEILCSKKDCNLYQDGVLFYYDSGHLSPEGAKLLKNSIENYLLEPN
jgi:hypothetical protein